MKHPVALFALAAALAAPATARGGLSQADLDLVAAGIDVRVAVLDNGADQCPGGQSGCSLSELRIRMPGRLPEGANGGDLSLYFSYVSPLLRADSEQFEAQLVNGDLHVLKPRQGARLEAGKTYTVRLWGSGHLFSAYYVMPNLYVASDGLAARRIASTQPAIDPESGLEHLPFVAPMTDEAGLATVSAEDRTQWLTPQRAFAQYAQRGIFAAKPDIVILPTPLRAMRPGGDPIDLRHGMRLHLRGVPRSALEPALRQLVRAGATRLDTGPELRIDVGPAAGLGAEAYRLTTDRGRGGRPTIHIRASDAAGAAYAIRSLAQQVAYEGGRLRPLAIEDSPRLPFRGLHVDVARNFHSKSEILKILEQMASYKLNRLHLHLGDDEGWRLEIRALPELAQVGGFRCHDPLEDRCLLPQLGAGPDSAAPVNGYFTQADYVEILRAARARRIEVIPSFDMPGHSRAAVRAMEARYRRLMSEGKREAADRFRLVEPGDATRYRSIQNYDDNTLNVCLDATYRFLDAVLDEVAALHAQAGMPLKTYHVGADETAGAWSQSPTCIALMRSRGIQAKALGPLFIERVARSLASRGIGVAGWSDGLGHVDPARLPGEMQSNIWGDLFGGGVAEAHGHANRGWRTVISMPNVTYFDSPYAPDPLERGYDWPSRNTDTFKVFGFMPENLAANASVMKDLMAKPRTIADPVPLEAGRRIGGLQGQLWSETVRSDAQADYMLFPRLIALAERAWHRGDWEPSYRPGQSYAFGDGKVDESALLEDWRGFSNRMTIHLGFLDDARIAYRLAPPGARIAAGRLEANTEFPGVKIEYRVGEGAWTPYSGPTPATVPVEVRSRTPDGKRASRSVRVAPGEDSGS